MKLKKFFLGATLLFSILTTLNFASAELINGYEFPENSNVGLKVEDISSDTVKQYYVWVSLRTKEGEIIHEIDGRIELDPKVFDMDKLSAEISNNFLEGDIFTNTDEISTDQLKNWFFVYKASTAAWFSELNPAEAFWFIVTVKEDNTSDTSFVKINSDNFRLIDTNVDPQANLFSWDISVEVSNLPVAEIITPVIDEPIIDTTPEVINVVPEEKPLVQEVQEDTANNINTGPKENLMLLFVWILLFWGLFILNRKEEV